jgi:hypothetical protein
MGNYHSSSNQMEYQQLVEGYNGKHLNPSQIVKKSPTSFMHPPGTIMQIKRINKVTRIDCSKLNILKPSDTNVSKSWLHCFYILNGTLILL